MTAHPTIEPCPFCNGEAVWRTTKGGQAQNFDDQYRVTCGVGYCAETPYQGTRADAAAWWNRRATGEEFLEFKEALSDLRSLRQEHRDLNGGGPNWTARNKAAWDRVDELFANEDEAAYDRHIESFYG